MPFSPFFVQFSPLFFLSPFSFLSLNLNFFPPARAAIPPPPILFCIIYSPAYKNFHCPISTCSAQSRMPARVRERGSHASIRPALVPVLPMSFFLSIYVFFFFFLIFLITPFYVIKNSNISFCSC